jgi:creatinine amidohydrolase/Fe(II)-dependent formamide hydrolase-like protein
LGADLAAITVMRHVSPLKLGLAVVAGLAITFFIVNRPLTAPLPNTIQISEMTWVEVRAALEHGFTTVIVPSGGIEQNGPHMIIGKHDHIVKHAAERIANELGKTLVAPVISYVPEGAYDPPTGNMLFPGTIGVPESVYAGMVEGIARSLKAGGFRTILFIADHGGSQAPQAETIARLNAEWAGKGVRVIHGDAYYSDAAQIEHLLRQGETRAAIGQHASIIDTSELMAVHPHGVDLSRLAGLGLSMQMTGIIGDPARASAERGKEVLELRIRAAVQQIRSQMATH